VKFALRVLPGPGLKVKTRTIEQMQELAESRGGQCFSMV
jgi:hypothetical protein